VRGRLWCLRLMLLLVVSALVFSPLAVRGATFSTQPVGWDHDPSALMLPSSPVYPGVVAYRDVRMWLAERSYEKSELLLGFANQDAAAINTMARRQDFVTSASHTSSYQQTFDRCVGWLVISSERGNDMSYLLARVKNDHLAQQSALEQAMALMPEWSRDSLDAARAHVAEVLLEAVEVLEGDDAARSYAADMASMHLDLPLPQSSVPAPAPSILVVPPQAPTVEESVQPNIEEEPAPSAPSIISLSVDQDVVAFKGTVGIICTLASEDTDDLSYAWWCSRGDLVASRTEAQWTAPKRVGEYEISVTVYDGLGRSDTRTAVIRVEEGDDAASDVPIENDDSAAPGNRQPAVSPEIKELLMSADHIYFDQTLGGGCSILVSRSCNIQCVVEDPDQLEFDWTVTGGARITGSGDSAVLTVPASPCRVTATVTTTNQSGDQDTASVEVYVTTCTYCF